MSNTQRRAQRHGMTRQQASDKFGVNVNGVPLAVSGFYVRTDRGTYERDFEDLLSLDECTELIRGPFFCGEKLMNVKMRCAFAPNSHFTL